MSAPSSITVTAVTAFTALIAVAVLLNAHTVKADKQNSIQCYECNSYNDTDCAMESVPERFMKNCSHLNIGVEKDKIRNYTVCRKMIQSIESEVNGLPSIKNRISRSCGWVESNYNDKCYHRSGFGGKQDVCTCSTDYCNSAQNAYIAFATVMAAASFAILIL